MNVLLSFLVLVGISACAFARESSPKIQVYSRDPGVFGKDNELICYVSDFHPPDIEIKLMKNGVEITEKVKQTDLAFEQGWKFHLTRSAPFKPEKDDTYTCSVRHLKSTRIITWEPDM